MQASLGDSTRVLYTFPAVAAVPTAAQVLRPRAVGELTRLQVPLGGDAGAAHLLLGLGLSKASAYTQCVWSR